MLWDHHKVGFLDEVFDIFDNQNHPVVLVEGEALCWMAVGLCTGKVRCVLYYLLIWALRLKPKSGRRAADADSAAF